MKIKAEVFKAHVMSIYSNGISQYAGETEALKQRLHVSIMNQCRRMRGFIKKQDGKQTSAEGL